MCVYFVCLSVILVKVSRTTPIATGGEPTPFYRAGGAMNSHPPRQPADGQVVKYVDEVIKGSLNVNEVNPQGTPLLHVVASVSLKNTFSNVMFHLHLQDNFRTMPY